MQAKFSSTVSQMINYPSAVNFGGHFINDILVAKQELPCLLDRSKQLFHDSFEELQNIFQKEKKPPRLVTEKKLFSYCPRFRDEFNPKTARELNIQGFFMDDIDKFKAGAQHILASFMKFIEVTDFCEKNIRLPDRAVKSRKKIKEIVRPFDDAARKYEIPCSDKGFEHPALSPEEGVMVEYPLVYLLFQAAAVVEEVPFWQHLANQLRNETTSLHSGDYKFETMDYELM